MPKLLSQKEAEAIAAWMTETYGLPPPSFKKYDGYSSANQGVEMEIRWPTEVRKFNWLPWPKTIAYVQIKRFYADNLEDALVKLKQELSKFDGRAKIAEEFREKFAMEEATEVLDEVLSK